MMKITEVLGIPPDHMLEKGQKTKRYFKRDDPALAYERIKVEKDYKPLKSRKIADLIGMHTDGPRGLRRGEIGHSKANYEQFEDLLMKLLVYDPELRAKPAEAIMHDFFRAPAHLKTATEATEADAARVDDASPDMFKETASRKHAGVTASSSTSTTAKATKPTVGRPAPDKGLARQSSKRLSDPPAGRRSV